MRYPVNVHTGSGMALTGTANSTSGSTLEGVQVAILDENDKIVQSAQAQVGGTSFSLKTLDDRSTSVSCPRAATPTWSS